jgi:hypothetical protein
MTNIPRLIQNIGRHVFEGLKALKSEFEKAAEDLERRTHPFGRDKPRDTSKTKKIAPPARDNDDMSPS